MSPFQERQQHVQQNYHWRKRTINKIKIHKSQIILESRENNGMLMNLSPLDSVKI